MNSISANFYCPHLQSKSRGFSNYRKIPKISPWAYIFQRPFLRGLFLEGLIFGGAYLRKEICVSKSIGLALWLEVNLPRGLYLEGQFNGGFFKLPDWGAYIWRGLYMEGLIFGILRYTVRDTQPASRGICMGQIILPGHFCGLHCWVRSSGPLPEQSLPPNWGEGLVQFLCLFIVPPPQVTLQDDHLDHSVYPPLTILNDKPVINKDNVNLR